jgi:hypothetical protein
MDFTRNPAAPSAPGYYTGIPNAAYHAGPGVSKSQLDLVHKAPALLEWSRNAPRDEEARAAVDVGDAFHAVALEPDRFSTEYVREFQAPRGAIVTMDDVQRACDERAISYGTKHTKAALLEKLLICDPTAPVLDTLRERWAEDTRGKCVLTNAEFRKVQLMRESAMAHPTARMLLEAEGDVEACIYWIDPITGELCRIRMDKLVRLPNGMRIQLDVKTIADVDDLSWSIEDYRYHVQDAFYTEGHVQHFGKPPDAFVFLVVGTQRNAGRYPVRCFSLDPDDKLAGAREFRADLNRYADCKRSGNWPGIEPIARPERVRRAAAMQTA